MKNTLSPLLLLLACALPLSAGDAPADTTPPTPPTPPVTASDGKLLLEFRGARLGQVLDHLSKEAGFIIANPIELAAPITLVAKQPLTPLEAVDALNSVLIDLGHVAIVRGKSLHVVTLPSARQQSLPVMVGADPAKIPDTDRMVTQVMPVQHATAKDLAENLQPLLNAASATLSANESSNVLILTDTQAHVRRIAAIIQAIDQSISGEQQVKVFHLAHADAEKVATIINNLYGNKQSSANNQQNRNNPFAGFNPFGGGNQGGGGRGGGGSGNNNNANAASGGSRGVDVVAAADSGTNSLVIKASADALEALGEVIKELDVDNSARDGVLLYRVLNGKAADLATALNNLFQGSQGTTGAASTTQRTTTQNRTVQGGAAATRAATPAAPAAAGGAAAGSGDSSLDLTGQVRVVADPTSNSVMILSPERNFERLKRLLIDLDQPLRQVLVRVLVAEVTLEKGLDLGVELDGVNPRGNTADSRVFSNFNIFDSTLGMNGYLLQTADFHATIRALASTTRFDVLSRPYILTTDTHEATVNVSQEVPIINGSRTDQNNNVTTTFDRRDVGIILTVTPQINSEGRVVLDVTQELSALADQTIPVGVGVQSPIINKRTMTTRVVVEHGQTAVVGGLVKDQLSETVRKIPLLGDIPVLGALFRRTISTKTQTELLVFLTPQVVQNPNDLADLARQLRGEMQRLDAAVEKDVLQHHLDQLNNLKLGQPLAPPVNSGKTKP